MHLQYRPALHLLWIVLLVAALVVLFPISARSNLELSAMASAMSGARGARTPAI